MLQLFMVRQTMSLEAVDHPDYHQRVAEAKQGAEYDWWDSYTYSETALFVRQEDAQRCEDQLKNIAQELQ